MAPSPEPELELQVGKPIERELSPGETQSFVLPVDAGRYLRVQAGPQAMDIALRLVAPDGATLAEADGPGGSKERELLSAVTTASGAHRLLVSRRDEGDRRAYRLELQELRPGRPDDETRVRAERAFLAGLHRLALGTKQDLDEALRQFGESLSLWQALGDRDGQVECLTRFGVVAYYRGESKDAIAEYEQALALAESAGYRRGAGQVLTNLGLAYARLGDRDATLRNYRRALEVWEELGDPAETARVRHNLGLFYLERGEAAPALENLRLALELREAARDVGGQASTLQTLGVLNLLLLGETRAALELFSRALPLSRTAGNLRLEAYLLGSLAAVHRQRGELQQALQLYREASDRFEALGDLTTLTNSLEALGGLYLDLGEFEKAANQYRRALRLYRERETRDFEARVLNSIGLTAFQQGNFQAALAAHDEALGLSRASGNRGTEITALRRRAMVRHARGELQAALADLEAGLALAEATGNQREKSATLMELGAVLRDLGDRDVAVERFQQALDLARHTEDLSVQSAVLLGWAELERDRGRLEAAKAMLEEALAVVESVRRGVLRQDLRETYFAARRSFYDAYIDLLMRLDDAHPQRHFAQEAFEASERSRARGLAELLAEGRIDVRRGIAEEFREREIRLGVQISKLQSSLLDEGSREARDPAKIERLEGELDEALEERKRLEEELRTRHPRYAQVRYPEPVAVADLQATLAPGTAFLEYVLGSEASYLFVVTHAEFHSFRLSAAHELQGGVERFRRGLARPERRLQGGLQQSAYELYEALVQPAAELLRTQLKWIIAPDGALHLVPFEALLTAPANPEIRLQDLPFLVGEHAIVYVPSAGMLRDRVETTEAGDGSMASASDFVAFADPLYGELEDRGEGAGAESAAGSALLGLPETRREVEAIAKLYPRDRVALYLGPEATEENVKAGTIASARRIHFAVHGHLDEVRPELSGLFLSRRGQSQEDGILQAYEIFNLDLQAELVVLSGCETGLGKQLAGEGLVGLSRAFFYAGAPSLVVSLWRVADASTADMMIEFHRRLNEGEGKAEALRRAKLRALASQRLAHPFHWASFILLGDG